ncbi:hypothetical protein GCM10027161_37510 [Microbispora hainanensis]
MSAGATNSQATHPGVRSPAARAELRFLRPPAPSTDSFERRVGRVIGAQLPPTWLV